MTLSSFRCDISSWGGGHQPGDKEPWRQRGFKSAAELSGPCAAKALSFLFFLVLPLTQETCQGLAWGLRDPWSQDYLQLLP